MLLRDASIRRKLMYISVLTTMVAVALVCASIVSYDVISFRRTVEQHVTALAQIIAENSTAPLSFGDADAAAQVLNALKAETNIVHACVYTKQGSPFAIYERGAEYGWRPPQIRSDGILYHASQLSLMRPIVFKGERIGTVYLETDLADVKARMRQYAGIVVLVVFASIGVAWILGGKLQKLVSKPIIELAQTADLVSRHKDYTIRASNSSRDELGFLIGKFNEMLGEIEGRDQELRQHRADLENEVAARTTELRSVVAQLESSRQAAEHAAMQDPLTKLPNRRFFQHRLSGALQRAERQPGYLCALLYLDIDRFKVINDSLGHQAGDDLLVEVATRLRSCLRRVESDSDADFFRDEDTVARLGGDEFAILLVDMHDVSDAMRVAERISQRLLPPIRIRDRQLSVSASIGISTTSSGYITAETMLRDADTALYRAKASGRNRSIIFDEAMHTRALERLHLESELRQAMERREFLLHYQPIVSLESGSVIGVEALLRWQSPTRGMVSPATFIHIAEEIGLIVSLGEWVLREACHELKRCMRILRPGQRFAVGVNISLQQFAHLSLVDVVTDVLRENDVEPERLRLELTESVAMDNPERTREMLAAMQRLGVRIAIDDFGTGYSSLNHLQRFSADVLKIDRYFVSQIGTDIRNENILKAMINLAHNLGMKVVAEGAETEQQISQLRHLGCDFVQGHFFFRAMPAATLEALLTSPAACPDRAQNELSATQTVQ